MHVSQRRVCCKAMTSNQKQWPICMQAQSSHCCQGPMQAWLHLQLPTQSTTASCQAWCSMNSIKVSKGPMSKLLTQRLRNGLWSTSQRSLQGSCNRQSWCVLKIKHFQWCSHCQCQWTIAMRARCK
jgi:hypothetical protein